MFVQIMIAVTGVAAILLTQQSNEALKKYASILGLAGQPFWLYSAYASEQWGIFVLCIFYTYAWALGVYNNWIKPIRMRRADCET